MTVRFQVSFENEYVRIVNVSIPVESYRMTDFAALPLVRIDLDSRKTRYVDSWSRQELARQSDQAVREIWVELRLRRRRRRWPSTRSASIRRVNRSISKTTRCRVVRLRLCRREKA